MISNQQAGDLRRCCDALEADNKRLRESLRWTAGALQTACTLTISVAEGDNFFLGADMKTGREILDAANAALAQEQGESNGS